MSGDAGWLTDITRWAGLSLALAGALSLNPHAAVRHAGVYISALRRGSALTKLVLGRVLPFLRERPTAPKNVYASARGSIGLHGTARATVGWGEGANVEAKLDLLRRRLDELDTRISEVQRDIKTRERDVDKRLAAQARHSAQSIEALHAEVSARFEESTDMDSRAIPVIAVGLLLSGIAPDAGRFQLWAWLMVLVGSCAFATIWVVRIWLTWARTRRA